jgi:hypothetical protein
MAMNKGKVIATGFEWGGKVFFAALKGEDQ